MIKPTLPDPDHSDSRKRTVDWLYHQCRQDPELNGIIEEVFNPQWPPFMQFVEWALKHNLLKPIPPRNSDSDK